MKRIIFTLIILVSLANAASAQFAGGDGTQANPWQIKTATQLDDVRNYLTPTEMKYFKLMNDIDLKDLGETTNWVPYTATVGNALNPTSANTNGAYMNFDGNGYVIKNLRIADPNLSVNYQSFTGFLWGRIQNLGLVNVYINCPKSGTVAAFGAYVGSATPGTNDSRVGVIENCFATGYISGGGGAVGGIIGMIGRPSNNGIPSYIKNCYFSGELYNTYIGSSATIRTGGIAAVVYANNTEAANTVASVENCYATGYFHTIKGRIGGIAGENYSTIKNNVAYADLEEEGNTPNSMGLVVGYCLNSGSAGEFGKADDCYACTAAKMTRGGTTVTPSYFTTPPTSMIEPVDGVLKTTIELSVLIPDISFAGGNGTQANPWQIKSAPQLDNVRRYINSTEMKYFKLMNDIDLRDLGEINNWTPYADGLAPAGAYMNFDGNGYIIKNMHISIDASTANYQSFAGYLWGKIQNLGLVNVYIDCPAIGGVGAFAGYLGSATPGANGTRTGIIEDCFATGYVSGGGGIAGGIVGSIGRPSNNGIPSYIKNCYFAGEVYNRYPGSGSAVTVRTGGIAGVLFANNTKTANDTAAPIENCYATGHIHALKGRVGGIAGETYSTIKNCVAYANLEEEGNTVNSMGLITGYCVNSENAGEFGRVENCWAYEEAVMIRNGGIVTPSHFLTPASGTTTPVDGTLKDPAFLFSASNYQEAGFLSPAWASQLQKKYPQLAWVAARTDAISIDGLSVGGVTTRMSSSITAAIENCYATGYFHSIKGRIGGIAGENNSTIKNNVAYANLKEEGNTPNSMGLIVGYCINDDSVGGFGKVQNCWAYEEAIMIRNGGIITPSHFLTPIPGTTTPVDGMLKDGAFLSNALNYQSGLDFLSPPWASQLQDGYPQLNWIAAHKSIDDLSGSNVVASTLQLQQKNPNIPYVFATGNLLIFEGLTEKYQVSVYNLTGSLLKSFEQQKDGAAIVLMENNTVVLVRMKGYSGKVYSYKLLLTK